MGYLKKTVHVVLTALITGPLAGVLVTLLTNYRIPAAQSQELRSCVAQARVHDLPYVIEGLAMLISLKKYEQGGDTADVRITYNLLALKDVRMDDRLFKEQFGSPAGAQIQHRFGSQWEEAAQNGGYSSPYYVHFEMNKGDIRSIVTGAKFVYPKPFALGATDTWEYPNDADVICDLVILIESDSYALSLPAKAARKLDEHQLPTSYDAFTNG